MKKSDIIALINLCNERIKNTLTRKDLTEEHINKLNTLQSSLVYDLIYFEKHVKEDDKDTIQKYYEKYSQLDKKLQPLEPITTKKHKVTKVIKETKQKETTKKKRKVLRTILISSGAIALVVAIMLTCSRCNGSKQATVDGNKPGIEQTIPKEDTIYDINIENEEELREYATALHAKLGTDTPYTVDQIMNAIRLANFHTLENKSHFETRESVYESTEVIGAVTTSLTSNSIIRKNADDDIYLTADKLQEIITAVTNNTLTLSDFETAKTNDKYDIYAIADVCIKNMYQNTDKDINYAKVFNDLVARQAMAMSITKNIPLGGRYSLSGMFNANQERLAQLTAGNSFGPIYGDGVKIDDTYGFICKEELDKYMKIGNEKNVVYTIIIDNKITNHYNKEITR